MLGRAPSPRNTPDSGCQEDHSARHKETLGLVFLGWVIRELASVEGPDKGQSMWKETGTRLSRKGGAEGTQRKPDICKQP